MSSKRRAVIVGASETAEIGRLPTMSNLDLHIDASCLALADAGLTAADVDGIAAVSLESIDVAAALGIKARFVDSTMVGGCSPLVQIRHAAAAIETGRASTVLVSHGESGRSRVGALAFGFGPDANVNQFQNPYGPVGAAGGFGMGLLRYMRDTGLTHEQLATVAVVQREWALQNPRAMMQKPITVDDVLDSPLVAYPLHLLECCLVGDGGGAVVLTSEERARDLDLPHGAVAILGGGEAAEVPILSMMNDLTSSQAYRIAGAQAFAEAGITPADVDHLMLYDAFAFLPIYGLEDLGFVGRGEAGAFIAEGSTAPGGRLPLNTTGGGLSYLHTGMYGMFAVQESIRQVRGTAAAQVDGVEISLAHAVGGMFWGAATLVLGKA